MRENRSSRELHAHQGRRTALKCDESRFDDFHVAAFGLDIMAHLRGRRTDKAVTSQNPEEGTDKCHADGVTDDLRTLIKKTHSMNDTQDRGDNTETRQSFRDLLNGVLSTVLFGMSGFDVARE